MDLTRKQVIEILDDMKVKFDIPKAATTQLKRNAALEYAISSLKTDEAYQLMYEGGEVFAKDDMVAMLEDLKQDFIAKAYGIEMDCTDYVVNVADIDKIIQQKINALKEKIT